MHCGKWLLILTALVMMFFPSVLEAKESYFEGGSDEIEENSTRSANTNDSSWYEEDVHADDWFSNPSKKEHYGSDAEDGNGTDEEAAEKKKKDRYFEIYRDETYIYSMDRKTAHYTRVPQTIDEKMIDVWIKLTPVEYTSGRDDYSYVPKYYLEHYLLRIKYKQVQFLCEMEVTGRPRNDIDEKRYDPRQWERLVPGSIEEIIYHAVLENKSKVHNESKANGTDARDYIENTFNISL